MREIVDILMRRDGITENEAWDIVYECQNEINYLLSQDDASIIEAENIIMDYLGLESDYLDCFLM